MAKASEQMEKALKVSECVPEIGTELHRERLLSKLLDEAVVDGDPHTILLFKGLVRAAGEEDDGEAGTLGECATSGEATAWLQLEQHSFFYSHAQTRSASPAHGALCSGWQLHHRRQRPAFSVTRRGFGWI